MVFLLTAYWAFGPDAKDSGTGPATEAAGIKFRGGDFALLLLLLTLSILSPTTACACFELCAGDEYPRRDVGGWGALPTKVAVDPPPMPVKFEPSSLLCISKIITISETKKKNVSQGFYDDQVASSAPLNNKFSQEFFKSMRVCHSQQFCESVERAHNKVYWVYFAPIKSLSVRVHFECWEWTRIKSGTKGIFFALLGIDAGKIQPANIWFVRILKFLICQIIESSKYKAPYMAK